MRTGESLNLHLRLCFMICISQMWLISWEAISSVASCSGHLRNGAGASSLANELHSFLDWYKFAYSLLFTAVLLNIYFYWWGYRRHSIVTCRRYWLCEVYSIKYDDLFKFNSLNAELDPICCLLALLGAHHFLHVSRIRVKSLKFRLLSYIYIYTMAVFLTSDGL
jgi:hypothetical protein